MGHDETRAARVVEFLFRAKLKDAIAVLNAAYDTAKEAGRHGTVVEISRRLLPWLYVAGGDVDLELLEDGKLGNVVPLPIGLTSFAEIVMAGFSMRAADFIWPESPDNIWPLGSPLQLPDPPEGGMGKDFLKNFRTDLVKRTQAASEAPSRTAKIQNSLINGALKRMLLDGKRISWICNTPPQDPDKTEKQKLMNDIAVTFEFLVVSETRDDLAEKEQDLFFDIHRLLRVVK